MNAFQAVRYRRLVSGLPTLYRARLLAVGVVSALASSQCWAPQFLPAMLFKPFADNRQWMLAEDVIYTFGITRISITVPAGFVTDFASIPQALWSFGLSPNGRYSKAAVIHDFLYWYQPCSRAQADSILAVIMQESGASKAEAFEIYRGVHLGSQSAWDQKTLDRRAGLPRVVASDHMNFGPLVLWQDYQKQLLRDGVQDPPVEAKPECCKFGDSPGVPTLPAPSASAI